MPSVAVVVLGDVGRSPRMQYHCTSLAAAGMQVSLVGYGGEKCVPQVEESPLIRKFLLTAFFAKASRAWFLLYAPLKVLLQLCQLFYILLVVIPRPDAYLVQNPPSIPALLAVWVASRLRGSRMVIDWHNFGYTVLSLSLGGRHAWLVRVAQAYEQRLAACADAHLCVTNAMRLWLWDNWRVRAVVLYDRPPAFFRRSELPETHDLLQRLAPQLPQFPLAAGAAAFPAAGDGAAAPAGGGAAAQRPPAVTALTEQIGGDVRLRAGRPAVLVSSTSWTEDEDFGLLLEALVALDAAAVAAPARFPDFLVLVTGKGPQRAGYEARMRALSLRRVAVRTAWLSPRDYPLLLGSADMGVCLHTSSSGLDLPMKVVDMFGAGLPVCAVHFGCLAELVRHGANGLVFRTAAELAAQLTAAFDGFPGEPSQRALARLREGVRGFQGERWQDNWDRHARALLVGPSGGPAAAGDVDNGGGDAVR